MTETVQDLGISIGIAVLGSISTASYRHTMSAAMPDHVSEDVRNAVTDSLWAALAIEPQLPSSLLSSAQAAFTAGFNNASLFSAVSVVVLSFLAISALRSVEKLR